MMLMNAETTCKLLKGEAITREDYSCAVNSQNINNAQILLYGRLLKDKKGEDGRTCSSQILNIPPRKLWQILM